MRLFGIIPAAGRAKRLSLPFSKELYPMGYYYKTGAETIEYCFRPVISFLIDRMVISGIEKIFVIINKDKFDIMRYLGNGKEHKVKISYLIQEEPRGMPEALGMVYDWSEKDSVFIFGMPDTIFYPKDALRLVLEQHISKKPAVTIGAFPTDKPNKYGMIEFDEDMNLTNVIDKPESSNLKFMWGIACWDYSFLHFLANYLDTNRDKKGELLLSDVFVCAINQGLSIKVLPFINGEYHDIGTIDDLFITIERIKHMA